MTSTTICAEYSTQTAEQQPVGPCVLRPGHRGHIHQDMRGVQWASRPGSCPTSPTGEHRYNEGTGRPESRTCEHCGAGSCCACGGGPVVYRNYLEQRFCAHCADCGCGERPCSADGQTEPATGGIVNFRLNEDGISGCILPPQRPEDTDRRARLIAAIRTIGRAEQENAELRRDNVQLLDEQAACIAAEQQRDLLTAKLREVQAELRSRDEAMVKQRSACQRALRDVAAVQRVRDLASSWYGQGAPATSYARELLATLDNAA